MAATVPGRKADRNQNKMRIRVLAVLFLALCVSCGRPEVEESFVKACNVADGGVYSFSIDMRDTLCRYDLSFYTRLDVRKNRLDGIGGIGLDIVWVSPTGERYGEMVDIPVPVSGNFFSTAVVVPYRTGLLPVEPGEWTLEVRVPDAPSGFRGLGVMIERKNGTR